MKTSIQFTVLASSLALVFAQQDPGPSPTNSFGCEPHDDHWHCEGAITPTAAPVTSPIAIASTTGAVVVVTTSSASASPTHDHDEDDHDHDDDHSAGATESLAPSPTASIGCEPHGDHWHCEGPRPAATPLTSVAPTRVISNTTTSATSSASTLPAASPSASTSLTTTGGASSMAIGYGALAGAFGLVGLLAL